MRRAGRFEADPGFLKHFKSWDSCNSLSRIWDSDGMKPAGIPAGFKIGSLRICTLRVQILRWVENHPLRGVLGLIPELGSWNSDPGTWNSDLGSWNLEFGSWNLELFPGTQRDIWAVDNSVDIPKKQTKKLTILENL